AGRYAVDLHGELRLGLRPVHGSVRGGIHDEFRFRCTYYTADRVGIRKIKGSAVRAHELSEGRKRAFELPADLALPAGEQDPQVKISATSNSAARRSLSLKMSWLVRGHWIANRGSSQRIARSYPGA